MIALLFVINSRQEYSTFEEKLRVTKPCGAFSICDICAIIYVEKQNLQLMLPTHMSSYAIRAENIMALILEVLKLIFDK